MIKPYVSPEEHIPEFTTKAVFLGVILVIVMTAANAYIGLYAGMTVSASIPAAVVSMALLRGVLRRGTVLENNIVQTMASAGEAIAGGVIFTVPALVMVGAWNGFEFWPTLMIALSGGLLGVIFAIPLRRALIVEEKELVYPEGVACAEVIKAGESSGGFFSVMQGFLLGGAFKYVFAAFNAARRSVDPSGTLETVFTLRGRPFFFGCDVSPALIGVGYIIGFEIAAILFLGGIVTWSVAVPLAGLPAGLVSGGELDAVWSIWSGRARYLGVGAMLVGGLWSIIAIRRGLVRGMKALWKQRGAKNHAAIVRTEWDVSMPSIIMILVFSCAMMIYLYYLISGSVGMSIGLAAGIAVLSFFAVAVSSYVVGLVGSSNNPVSGITVCCLMIVAAVLYLLGMRGEGAMASSLVVAGVVCCAACASGDMSQDLKTGYLLGATPRMQQVVQMLGVVIAAFIMSPVLTLLHFAYGIGDGLRAPQATLFAGITRALFGDHSLPMDMVLWGVGIGLALVAVNLILAAKGVRFRFHIMPFAVGMYLPLSLTLPMFLGGIVSLMVRKIRNGDDASNKGVLLSSGMIAGEAVMGIAIAVLILMRKDYSLSIARDTESLVAVGSLVLVLLFLFLVSAGRKGKVR